MKSDETSLAPILVAAAGIAVFIGLDATMKGLVAVLPLAQAVLLRYVAGVPFAALLYLRRPRPVPLRSLAANAARGALIVCVATSFFYAVTLLPLADVIAVQFLAPFFIAILGRVLLKEHLDPRVLVGLAIGFLGVVVILHGQFVVAARPNAVVGFGAAICAAFLYALANVLVRMQSRHDSAEVMVLVQTAAAAVCLAPFGLIVWETPTLEQAGAFLLCGLLGTVGQLAMAWALTNARAARVAMLEYTAFLWAALFGFVFYAEMPTASTVAGAAVIVVACVIALRPRRTAVAGRATARGAVAAGYDPAAAPRPPEP
jgi:drug/metabolite transporter (DMT)-like permease